MVKKSKNIEEIYMELTPEEHVLTKPSMYLGSIKNHTSEMWLYDGDKMILEQITYIPAFLKLFDEIITNSIDESKRKGSKLNVIKVNVDKNKVTVYDNGGIPIVVHKVKKQYIPEMVFGSLRAGSNFDDTDNRTVAGTYGLGSSLVNLFSKKFTISSCDGKKRFEQTFTNNMKTKSKPKITTYKKNHTEISYETDFARLGMSNIDDIHYKLLYKRTMDLAGINPNLKIYFNDELLKINSFKDYISLYAKDVIIDDNKHKWKLAVSSSEMGYKQISFVNAASTYDGGTHVDYIVSQIISKIREFLLKKHKIDVKPSEIKNHMMVFLDSEIINPLFSSQTKEKLITENKDFGTEYIISDKFIQQIIKSEIVSSILDWYAKKKEAEENKELRKLNNSLSKNKISKLIDAKSPINREKCELFIIEGDSAATSIKKFRNPMTQGAYPLRGKFINVYDVPSSKLIQDEQVLGIMGALGLKLGEKPTKLRYGKIYILTDADVDGSSIAASLMNFFYKYWKDLFIEGRIYLNVTPLLVAVKNKTKERIYFYSDEEFKDWSKKVKISDYDIDYKKGLAALSDIESKKMLEEPKLIQLTIGSKTSDVLYTWFGDNTQLRKNELLDK